MSRHNSSSAIAKLAAELASEERVIPECPQHGYQKGGLVKKVAACRTCQEVDFLSLVCSFSPERRDERLASLHSAMKQFTQAIEQGRITSADQIFETPKVTIS